MNTTTTIAYRNFIPVSNTTDVDSGLGEWPASGDLRTQTQFKLFNAANQQIGTTRIKSVIPDLRPHPLKVFRFIFMM